MEEMAEENAAANEGAPQHEHDKLEPHQAELRSLQEPQVTLGSNSIFSPAPPPPSSSSSSSSLPPPTQPQATTATVTATATASHQFRADDAPITSDGHPQEHDNIEMHQLQPSEQLEQSQQQSDRPQHEQTEQKQDDQHQSQSNVADPQPNVQASIASNSISNQQAKVAATSHQQLLTTSKNILEAINDFDSSIPDAVVHHFLNSAGMQTSDQRIIRLIAIAAQKFIHDIVSDSLQHCKLRGTQGKKTKEKKYTLAIEDLAAALAEYGIEVRRQQYFN